MHPRQQMRPQTAIITAPSFTQGAQSRTLGCRYPANHPPNPSYPTPREHHTAPSAADTNASHRHSPPNPCPRSTILHPRQRKTRRLQPQPPQPTPREHYTAPSAAKTSAGTARALRQPRTAPSASVCKGPATAKADAGLWSNTASEPCGSPPAANRLNRADHSWKPV